MNLTYLIGNGFDIGLGLKTDYCAPDAVPVWVLIVLPVYVILFVQ